MLVETSRCGLAQKPRQEGRMNTMDYIGFDIHKKAISFCAKAQDGTILEEGTIPALRNKLLAWAKAALDGSDGSDAVYRVDLRSAEAVSPGVEGSAPADAESHRSGQEEERQSRRADDRRSIAVQSTAGVLHGTGSDPRFAADAALPQSGGATDDTDEEPHGWSADGIRGRLQQATAAWQGVLQRVVKREFAGGASLGGGTAAA